MVTTCHAQSPFMIPDNKQSAVKKALQTAFRVSEFDSIQQLTEGLSTALTFKIIVQEKPYLLRVITRTDAMADPSYYYDCMKIAAEKELAPRIHYLNTEDRISITDFINEQPFPIAEGRERLPELFRKLHSLPKFPFRLNYFDRMEGLIQRFRSSDVLPGNMTKEFFELYDHIASVYPRKDQENWVSCHNDVKPENIVFDGHRPWLVDWEAAFLNDRYLDLAIIANFVIRNDKDEENYLQKYFGQSLNEYHHARFFLMRQMLHMFYFTFLTLFHTGDKPIDINSVEKQDFTQFHDGMWNSEISLASDNIKLQYALLHMEQLRRNMQLKRLDESLQIVSRSKSSVRDLL